MNRARLLAALTFGLFVLGACGGLDGQSASTTTTSTSPEELRLPVQVTGESYGHRSVPLTGVLALTGGGCWTIDLEDEVTRLVVFPEGTARAPGDPVIMVGPDGTELSGGLLVDGRGGVVAAARFPDVPDGYWGNYLAFCDPAAQEFVVLDSVGPAFVPETLTPAELAGLAREANFTNDWGCGIGFAASDSAQHVALVIHLADASLSVESPVVLPDDHWFAEVLVGKRLMAEWCNDAIESWVSLPDVVVRWPLTAGTLEFTPPEEGYLYQGASVAATLRGAEVMTPVGVIELGDIQLLNEHFGVFAG